MKQIKRYYTISADPQEVYNALTNKKILEIWTGEEVVMELKPNTEFSLWDGNITGINLEFEENKKIVQQWFFGEDAEAEASIVTIKIHAHKKGTSVELLHTNIPDDAFQNISDGWDEDYFGALTELFI
jgi:activator of HSP90 ATPase